MLGCVLTAGALADERGQLHGAGVVGRDGGGAVGLINVVGVAVVVVIVGPNLLEVDLFESVASADAEQAGEEYRLPAGMTDWHAFQPSYFATAIGAWMEELGDS